MSSPATARVIIAVGSNIEPDKNIKAARNILESLSQKGLVFIEQSPLLRTKPEGKLDQPDFLNCAFLIETHLDEVALDQLLKNVETALERTRTKERNGPRTIDLDIVVWNGRIIDEDYQRYDFVRASVEHLLPINPNQ